MSRKNHIFIFEFSITPLNTGSNIIQGNILCLHGFIEQQLFTLYFERLRLKVCIDFGSITIRTAFAFENIRNVSLAWMLINEFQLVPSKKNFFPSSEEGALFITRRILPSGLMFSKSLYPYLSCFSP